MLPAANTTPRIARPQTREAQILALLTERRGEKLTATAVARALKTEVENVRTTLNRMHRRRAIGMSQEIRSYKVGNSICKHRAALWYVPVQESRA